MPVFVRDDICLRERASLCPEAAVQLVKETNVQVHLLVDGAVERTLRGLRRPATGLCCAGVQHHVGRRVAHATPRQLRAPVVLHAVDDADHAAIGTRVRVSAGSTALGNRTAWHLAAVVRVGRYAGGTRRAETTTQQVECEQEQDEEESSAATAHDDRHAQSATAGRSARAARLATLVLNLARIELRVLVESHEAARESAS